MHDGLTIAASCGDALPREELRELLSIGAEPDVVGRRDLGRDDGLHRFFQTASSSRKLETSAPRSAHRTLRTQDAASLTLDRVTLTKAARANLAPPFGQFGMSARRSLRQSVLERRQCVHGESEVPERPAHDVHLRQRRGRKGRRDEDPRSVRVGNGGHGRGRSGARDRSRCACSWCIPGPTQNSWTHAFKLLKLG